MSDNVIYSAKYKAKYSDKYDAYYNYDTGEWLEKKCSDPECYFCADRPDNAIEENVNG